MPTTFICEKCATVGEIQDEEDVMTVVYRIEEAHQNLSPNCTNPVSNIRVLNKGFLLKREVV